MTPLLRNATRHRERAEKYLTAKSLNSRSPVDAMVIRRHQVGEGQVATIEFDDE